MGQVLVQSRLEVTLKRFAADIGAITPRTWKIKLGVNVFKKLHVYKESDFVQKAMPCCSQRFRIQAIYAELLHASSRTRAQKGKKEKQPPHGLFKIRCLPYEGKV